MDIKNAIDIIHDVVNEGFTVGDRVFSIDDEEREALETAISALEVEQFCSITEATSKQTQIFAAMILERKRQDEKWGEQNHFAERWVTIIGEEYGEMCKAVNEFSFNPTPKTEQDIYTETIQTMASCLAMLECMQRSKNKNGGVA